MKNHPGQPSVDSVGDETDFPAMIDDAALIEIFIRSMNAGASLLIALVLVSKRPVSWRHALAALFSISVASYVVASSPILLDIFGAWFAPFYLLSICAGVIFWWFSLALFDDGFRWRWRHLIPLVMTAPLVFAHFMLAERAGPIWVGALGLARMALIFCYGHAIFTALRFANDDLLEGRRRFRGVFAIAVAVMGLIVVYAETVGLDVSHPQGPMLAHAVAIAALTFSFGAWIIGVRVLHRQSPISPAPTDAASMKPTVKPADRRAYETLIEVMNGGAWREDGLTVARLAEEVGVPDHALRRLINGELGHRNFSAFLNSYRLEEAKRLLADPGEARRQILQIALDVGFGSIAPFNRAFKEATGKTPTDFRKAALGEPRP